MVVGVAGVIVAATCTRAPAPAPAPAPAGPPPSGRPALLQGTLPTMTEEVTLRAGERTVPGTLVAPSVRGPWPAVVLLAGSGPTDRDWNSPLLPARNGSGKLLADELARHGVVVLRFDKAAAGTNPGPSLDQLTIDTYRDEAAAAIALVRGRADVRADRVFVAGHSEGGIHATRVAAVAPGIAGVIYLSSASRTMADILLTQLEGNLRNPLAGLTDAQVAAELASLRAALDAFLTGQPVDPKAASTIPKLQQLVAGLTRPATAVLTRALLGFDNAAEAAKLAAPLLVVSGGKDVQVDPELDGRRLAEALRGARRDVTFHIAPDADHVLKHEPKSLAALRADLLAAQTGYNAEGRVLDADAVGAIVAWLVARG